MKHCKFLLGLMFFWIVLGGALTPRHLLSGFFATLMTWVVYRWLLKHAHMDYAKAVDPRQIALFVWVVLIEILSSGIAHVARILGGRGTTEVTTYDLTVDNDTAKMLIANAITLTPGSLALDVTPHNITVLHFTCDTKQLHTTQRYLLRLEKIFK